MIIKDSKFVKDSAIEVYRKQVLKNGSRVRLKFVRRRREVSRTGRNSYWFRIKRNKSTVNNGRRIPKMRLATGFFFFFSYYDEMQRGQDNTRTGWTHFKHGGVRRTRAPLVDQYRTSITRCLMSVFELLRACSRNRQDIYSKCDSCINDEHFQEINVEEIKFCQAFKYLYFIVINWEDICNSG